MNGREVEYTNQFEMWWNGLTEEEQIELDAKVRLLEQHGPVLPRPHSDVIVTSKHANINFKTGQHEKLKSLVAELSKMQALQEYISELI